ncbi:hypothetical protein [Brevibacillus laterosporus]|uniref:Uncharacterized protein n=1 Tax=Brevibacillus laterosporus TaxID=1465 RepID=A0AAP3DKZ2_BRELA|nr:hypothetical protein [Brevibacillus laterosporus]MCR8983090.1 hypothetical protein [Brevibacillus laterosporus]MCZ0810246.1 hypothetical protein [Brevibacillus laterosporus]MCZ0828899.1 hypothetical protein [Brevibacillus laterosporus]MCZ0852954.1 hypothetical protein [Brevibacillus laterosporus]
MSFVAHNFAESLEAYISVDKFNRLYLSSALRNKLGIVPGTPFKCHVGYDPATGNIGIARPGEVSVEDSVQPATFDGKRYYAAVSSFIRKNNVPVGKYLYIERSNNWYAFRHENHEAPSTAPVSPGRGRKKS